MKKALLLLVVLAVGGLLYGKSKLTPSGLQEGDIIFQTSLSAQSKAIQVATQSPYSHMGILLKTPRGLEVFEAVNPVRYIRFDRWVRRGENWHYVVKRLKNADTVLTKDVLAKMHKAADGMVGKPYDMVFEWSDEKIYCSELVWKIYDRAAGIKVGSLATLKDFDLTSPVVKAKLKERYGDKVPMSEKVISPKDMFDSELLETVK